MFWKLLALSIGCLNICTAANSQTHEVHAVAVFEGDIRTGEIIHGPEARVTLDRPDTDVTLILGSQNAVRWFVEKTPETRITMIYVHGHDARRSEVLLNGVSFDAEFLDIGSTHRDQGSQFRNLVETLALEFGVPGLASFQGAYEAPDEPFVVNSVEDDGVNQVDYLQSQLRPEALTDNLRQFLEHSAEPVARLEESGFFLHLDGEDLHFPIRQDLPDVSGVIRATYDPVNQILYARTASPVRVFYAYDILNDRWSGFVQPRGSDIRGAVYDGTGERWVFALSGIRNLIGENSRLVEIPKSGGAVEVEHDALVGITDLRNVEGGPGVVVIPLVIDGTLLLVRAENLFAPPSARQVFRLYLIDLDTGQVTLVGMQG